MKPESSLPYSQASATSPYPEPTPSSYVNIFTIIYFIIVSLFMGLILKIMCNVKQDLVDIGKGCSSDGKMPYAVDKQAANQSICTVILNTFVVICT